MEIIKLKLTIAYDGTNYFGWQIQKTALGVQQKIEEALAKIFKSAKRIHSSSRTDTGVHALGLMAHVEIPKAELKIPASRLALAINAYLPPDIRIMSATRCAARFHARYDAKGKQYRYFVWNNSAMNPLLRQRAWHVPQKLDLVAMRTAAKLFLGQHNFKSLAATRSYEMKTNVRTLTRCDIKKNGALITLIVEGDGFLYKMCRGIVGTLVQVGQRKIAPDEIKKILESKDRRSAGVTAPAHGLVLWKVFYEKNLSRQTRSSDGEKIIRPL